MKKIIPSVLFLLFISRIAFSQNLAKQWDHTYGGDLPETMTALIKTADGGFLLGGYTMSDSGYDVSEFSRGGRDFWVVKTDSLGQKLWDKRFGGDFEDRIFSVDQTTDGGYILGGFTTSDSGADVSQTTRGSMDYWIVRIDSTGNKLWDKRFGGASYDQLSSVRQTPDGGFILGGWSFSDSTGDVSQHTRGAEDFWVVKTDANGIKQWDKRYGGDQNDELAYLENSTDGGYILGGRTASDNNGDVTQSNRGLTDYWLVKIDISGNKLWDKRYGGDLSDVFLALDLTYDGGYILGGFTQSTQSGEVSYPSRDTATVNLSYMGDIWIVKTNSVGNKVWDKRYGGDQKEDAFGYIEQTLDSGYIFASASYSSISGDKTENNLGMEQSWLVRLDSSGGKKWDKTIYTNGEDEFAYPIQINDSCYVIGNWSYADSAGFKSEPSRGGYDYWIVKFCESTIPQLPVAGFTVSNTVLCSGGCFTFENLSYNAGSFEWFFPGADVDYSTDVSPIDICYQDTGHYTVTLVASNPNGTDTLVQTDLIYIAPLPEFNIVRNDDTLFAPAGYQSYQWYFNGSPLIFDTLYYYFATQNGDYSVSVVDSFGCPGSEGILNVTVGVKDFSVNRYVINVFPNPAQNYLNVTGLEVSKNGILRISDISGREVYSANITSKTLQVPVSTFVSGIYILQVESETQKMYLRFVRQ